MTDWMRYGAAGLAATVLPFLCTSTGAAAVFLTRPGGGAKRMRTLLGFAAGVMLAASVFSLLLPAAQQAEALGLPGWAAACGGFAAGAAFLLALDRLLARTGGRRRRLAGFAITLHNLPEGMAVGLAAALALKSGVGLAAGAGALALGVGIQNLPEGAAVSLPRCQQGESRPRAFLAGVLSGLPEPAGGFAAGALAGLAAPALPWMLAFAAGAMVYVSAEELIPTASAGEDRAGTLGLLAGFVLMMALDMALG